MNNFSNGFIILLCVFFLLLIRLQLNVQKISVKKEVKLQKIQKAKLLKYITSNMEGTEQEYNVNTEEDASEQSKLIAEEIYAEEEESEEEPILCTIS